MLRLRQRTSAVDNLITQFLDWKQKSLAPRSQTEYNRDLRYLDSWLKIKGMTLATANRVVLAEYIAKVPVGRRLTNRKLSVFRTFYSWLVDMGMISVNPTEIGRAHV